MSDVLTNALVAAAEAFVAAVKKGGAAPTATNKTPAATGGATPNKAEADKAAAAKKAEADKAAAAAKEKATKEAAAKAAAAKAGAASGTKAPGGKHTIDDVREIIRKVATSESLGKQSAIDILNDDGGGVSKVVDLKPEFFDAVYEACQVLLNNEGGAPAASTDDDLLG